MISTAHWSLNEGDLLVAPPRCQDPRFRRSVVMVTHLTSRGSYGLCLNRATENTLESILRPVEIQLDWDQPLYWGGPVNVHTVWMLHEPQWQNPHSMSVDDHWAMTSHISMFEQLRDQPPPQRQRITFGFASWGPGQLDRELTAGPTGQHRHSWLIVNRPDPDWLIDCDSDDMWGQALEQATVQAVDHWL